MAQASTNKTENGVWLFYAVFLILLFAEGGVVHFLGLWISLLVFIVIGALLGIYELNSIKSDQKLRDPILSFGFWMQRRFGIYGYLFNAIITGGSPGAAIALKKLDHPHKRGLTLLAAVLFAVVWVPLWHYIW